MQTVRERLRSAGHAVSKNRSWSATLLACIGLLFSAGCVPDANRTVVDAAKEASEGEPWFDDVEDWNAGTFGTIEVETNFPEDEIESYLPAYEICVAITSKYADAADSLPNLQIYGTRTSSTTKVDGSTETDVDRTVIAQAVITTDYECGINPPHWERELFEQAQDLGVPVHS